MSDGYVYVQGVGNMDAVFAERLTPGIVVTADYGIERRVAQINDVSTTEIEVVYGGGWRTRLRKDRLVAATIPEKAT